MSSDDAQALAALMERYCEGRADAFAELYQAVAPRVFAYLVALSSDRTLAEDLLQQTFLRVHQARGHYVLGANPLPWIFTIAHRLALDEFRRRKRQPAQVDVDAHEHGELGLVATLTGASPHDLPDSRAQDVSLTQADLDELPHNQKEALILTKVQGHSVAEAAAITGSTVGAIKLRAHRAYATLREKLNRRNRRNTSDVDPSAPAPAPAATAPKHARRDRA